MTVKSKLLGILEQQKGETLSGEKLAEELHCTRAGHLEGSEGSQGRRIYNRSRTE